MNLIKKVINFLLIGTKPIRIIEGFTLIFSFFFFSFIYLFFSKNLIFSYSSLIILSISSILAFLHLKGCRGSYEMRMFELEALTNRKHFYHNLMRKAIISFEYYLILFAIILFSIFLLKILFNIFNYLINYLIITTPFVYSFISFTGHLARVYAINSLKEINKIK